MDVLRKILTRGISALLGAGLGLLVSAGLMIAEVKESDMLPVMEPEEKVLVLRSEFVKDYAPGDLVVYQAPYYMVDGAMTDSTDDTMIRRVTGVRGEWIRLNCEKETAESREVLTKRETLLGKIIFPFPKL